MVGGVAEIAESTKSSKACREVQLAEHEENHLFYVCLEDCRRRECPGIHLSLKLTNLSSGDEQEPEGIYKPTYGAAKMF